MGEKLIKHIGIVINALGNLFLRLLPLYPCRGVCSWIQFYKIFVGSLLGCMVIIFGSLELDIKDLNIDIDGYIEGPKTRIYQIYRWVYRKYRYRFRDMVDIIS